MRQLKDDLALAFHLVDCAAEIALAAYNSAVRTRTKADGSPVTDVDLAIERALLEILAAERPDDGVLGEEFGARGQSTRRWILDPIDGTFNFVADNPAWGTHVALEDEGEIVLGVVSRPARNERWWATRGGGAYKTDLAAPETPQRLQVSTISDLAHSRISIWRMTPDTLMERVDEVAILCPPELDDILRLANGEREVVIDLVGQVWDHAPVTLLVEEAGGRFADAQGGRRMDLGEGRYTNGHIDEAFKTLLEEI